MNKPKLSSTALRYIAYTSAVMIILLYAGMYYYIQLINPDNMLSCNVSGLFRSCVTPEMFSQKASEYTMALRVIAGFMCVFIIVGFISLSGLISKDYKIVKVEHKEEK